MSKELGQALRILRKHCELTQKQVAEILHIDRSTYAFYECGKTEPDLKTIAKLARIFGVDPTVFLPNDDGKPSVRLTDVTGPVCEEVPPEEESFLDPRDEKIYSIAKDERSVLIWYRTLTQKQREKLKAFAKDIDNEEQDA